eukprot:PITA_22286
MVEPKRVHWVAGKHVLRYIQGTIKHGLLYTQGNDIMLSGFADVDWVGISVDRKSTIGYYFNTRSGMTSWCSRKRKSVALRSVEVEYMAPSRNSCEAIWLRRFLVNLFRRRMEATRILCDNQSYIKFSDNPIFHDWLKHIDIRCHFVRDCVQRGVVKLRYTPTGEHVATILTKALKLAMVVEVSWEAIHEEAVQRMGATGQASTQSTDAEDQCDASIVKHY